MKNNSGLNPSVSLLNIRSRDDGFGSRQEDAAAGIIYAVDNGAKIINCSWGHQSSAIGGPADFIEPFQYAFDNDVIVVTSAGNADREVYGYPGLYEETITVTGLNDDFSERGDVAYGSSVHFAMPAIRIKSTSPLYSNNDQTQIYWPSSGTSFAAPIVTAIVSRLLTYDSSLTKDQIMEKLIEHSELLPDGGIETGYGKINTRSLAEDYVNIEEISLPTIINGEESRLDIRIVRDKFTNEILRKVIEYIWIDNKKYPLHKEFQFE